FSSLSLLFLLLYSAASSGGSVVSLSVNLFFFFFFKSNPVSSFSFFPCFVSQVSGRSKWDFLGQRRCGFACVRGRGKGKKLTAVTSHEDLENGIEDPLPAYRRRGRLQKPLKDDIGEDDAEKNEGGADDTKITLTSKELKGSTVQKGRKRKRSSLVKDKSDSVSEENGDELKPKNEESTGSNGFRHNGNRRKSKPHRAAEA
ncbi:unnamed protein product, partial [Musa acuminata var. zebrina]